MYERLKITSILLLMTMTFFLPISRCSSNFEQLLAHCNDSQTKFQTIHGYFFVLVSLRNRAAEGRKWANSSASADTQ